jgi:hypothetical protein
VLVASGKSNKYLETSTPAYPPPEQSTSQPFDPNSNAYSIFLPLITRQWVYLPVTAPPNSISIYIKDFANNALYNAGCEQGAIDLALLGAQNSIVFIHFGQPYKSNNIYGVRLHETYEFKSMSEIADAVVNYAHGYYQCTGSDFQSQITIAIGTSNDFSVTVQNLTYNHGFEWAQLMYYTDSLLEQTIYTNQVDIAGGSNMELSFDSSINTENWVEGFDFGVSDLNLGPDFLLYSVGDAVGCAPYFGQCGTEEYIWSQDDVWYISFGCNSCYPLPMIYAPWTQAEQWQNLSKYSKQMYGYKILFRGTTTQAGACDQRPLDKTCPTNQADEGYRQLFTVLNSSPDTSISETELFWSTDMKWWGEQP